MDIVERFSNVLEKVKNIVNADKDVISNFEVIQDNNEELLELLRESQNDLRQAKIELELLKNENETIAISGKNYNNELDKIKGIVVNLERDNEKLRYERGLVSDKLKKILNKLEQVISE